MPPTDSDILIARLDERLTAHEKAFEDAMKALRERIDSADRSIVTAVDGVAERLVKRDESIRRIHDRLDKEQDTRRDQVEDLRGRWKYLVGIAVGAGATGGGLGATLIRLLTG